MASVTNESFALNGSFVVAIETNKTPSRIQITEQPEKYDNSPLCQYIQKCFPIKTTTIPKLLASIEDDHKQYPNLYLTKREVVLIPGEEPLKPVERIQCIKDLLAHLFTQTQIETSAQGYAKIAVGTITDYQKYVLTNVVNHFHRLLINDNYYNTPESRKDFYTLIFSLFIPISLKTSPVRIAAPVDLLHGSLPVSSPRDLCIIVKSPTDIQILSHDTMSWPSVEYDDKSYVDGNLLHLKSVDSEKYVDLICHANISPTTWRQILWPNSAPHRTSIISVIESCKSFGNPPKPPKQPKNAPPSSGTGITPSMIKNSKMNAAAATGIARAVSSIDNSFSLAFYATFVADNKVFERVLKAMLVLFISEHREMQLLKLVAYFELDRTIDLNEMFRKNNNYFRTITFYVNFVSDEYKRTTVKDLHLMIAAADMWSFDHPDEKDLQTVDTLIHKFFTILIEQIDKIPPNVRTLCRYLRLLSERKFRDPKLIYRAIYAVFLLRFIFPSLCAPMDLGIDMMKIKQRELAKVIQFTKLLAFAGQNQHIVGEHQGDRKSMNDVIDKNTPLVIKFYNAICTEGHGETSHITKTELIESAMVFHEYVLNNEKALSEFTPPQLFENIYVDELLTEFVSSSLE
ncbi:hypothetical protein TRFO_28152 [Tritrichomonas foetus]|uniref:Ras-GAP domain-containing protein n=1 Tax=Tritrichomonas foetus TaxID=1144522 RepID=A0A1J4K3K9_9EUKA|nr:hypothetical protein TRFO_28152 [Tritrichomonas foetus]|eukprot:OHT04332.1 hypothetical protein TRFO_28152 [Tritrichomonas foetus]